MRQNTDLTDKVAVITGATSGIGLALAAHAAKRGMRVALVDGDQERLPIALEQLSRNKARMTAIYVDMSDLTGMHKLAQRIETELGPPWLVCNNCETDVELNLHAVTYGVQVFAPVLAQRGEGHIVNIISAHCCSANFRAVYAAALHAIVGLSESLYRELDCMGSRVGVSLVCPAGSARNCKILTREHRNSDSLPGRPRASEAVHPERLAEGIFGAVATRRFRLFSDRPETDYLYAL
jgi:short-subunit dehydrogenase